MTTDSSRTTTPKQVRPTSVVQVLFDGSPGITCISAGSEFATKAGDIYLRKNHEYWFQHVKDINDYVGNPNMTVEIKHLQSTQPDMINYIDNNNLGEMDLKVIARSITEDYDWVSTSAVDFDNPGTINSYHFEPSFAPTPPVAQQGPGYDGLHKLSLRLSFHTNTISSSESVLIGVSWSHTAVGDPDIWNTYWNNRQYDFIEKYYSDTLGNEERYHYSDCAQSHPFQKIPT